MAVGPVEFNYQTGRTLYYFRVSDVALTVQVWNNDTLAWEPYDPDNWADYAISIPETIPGFYRAIPPSGSLLVAATEIYYEVQDALVGPQVSDAPAIGNGNSQGVNIGSVGGDINDIPSLNPTVDLSIINLALTHIGQQTITTIDDANENARKSKAIFNFYRDSVLRDCSWNFAKVTAKLQENPLLSLIGSWQYVYELPISVLTIRKVFTLDDSLLSMPFFPGDPSNYAPDSNPKTQPFDKIYQSTVGVQSIVCNLSEAYIDYTCRITDSSQFDSQFVEALSYKLAAKLAMILCGDKDEAKDMEQMYQQTIAAAKLTNGNERPTPNRQTSPYIDVR
jgi:hypothetical protein